jgi:acetyl esterase/lipase
MILMSSCESKNNAPGWPLPAEMFKDVSYGKDSLQVMDIHLPAGRSKEATKVIVLIHGGGWNGGSKSEFNAAIDSIKKRMPAYAIFNLDYRLVNGGNHFPAQELDVKGAIQFIGDHAGEYQVNMNKVALLGYSAGAHLALLQAYKYRDVPVKAVVDFFGPTDLVTMYQHPWHTLVPYALQMITGTTPKQNIELYRQSSPVNFINSTSPPTLILHGAQDQVVDLSQSKLLQNKLQQAGVVHQLKVYPKERHGWYGATLAHSFTLVEEFLDLEQVNP